jgi:AraC-like DNA-binding protein/ligand-binding sensor protein
MQTTIVQREIATRNFSTSSAVIVSNNGHSESKENKNLIEALATSKIYQDYERAFSEMTGMPVSLRPVESWQLPQHGKKHENPFCGMMAEKSRSCAACLRLQQELANKAQHEAQTLTCELGLCDTAVPVRLGDKLIGFLQTGQVFRKKPTTSQFNRTAKLIAKWGVEVDSDKMRAAYFDTKVVSPKQHDAMVNLLAIFAQHISMVSNQVLVQERNAESPLISRAKRYIEEKQGEDLSLTEVAKAVNTSTFYFCKMFKKATGLHFTEYVSRVRIEKAKNLLLNPNLRVSEVAFEVGFQSLTHFNRVFKKIVHQSPTEYREQLAA